MILKEIDITESTDKFLKAGIAAEKQMAFYLRRKFDETKGIFVFNDLKIRRGEETAQIDHLIVHKHGMIIIESKSVTGQVQINAQGEWVRSYGRNHSGMPSPVLQARRQGAVLRSLLQDNAKNLRGKALLGLMQAGFKSCPIQILVAISDQGIIKRGKQKIPELLKADQIADEADGIISRHRKGGSLIGKKDGDWGMYVFKPVEQQAVAKFLLDWHTMSSR